MGASKKQRLFGNKNIIKAQDPKYYIPKYVPNCQIVKRSGLIDDLGDRQQRRDRHGIYICKDSK